MLDNQQERRAVGRPSKPNRKQRINVTMSPETLQDIEEHIPEKQRSLHIELTLQAVHDSIFSLLTKINSDVVIRSIEPVGLDTLTEECSCLWRVARIMDARAIYPCTISLESDGCVEHCPKHRYTCVHDSACPWGDTNIL